MKLVLIDRDGVINEELPGYVKSIQELKIYDNALKALALLRQNGFTCVVVTNQSVVGRGIISKAALDRIHAYMCDAAASHGGLISEVFICTDTPDKATFRRKPTPGMLLEALEKYKASPEKTPFIGDALTDMQAALAAGCPRYLVLTGKGRQTLAALSDDARPMVVCAEMLDAARKIVESY